MAHYAKLDENNSVLEVNVVDNEVEDEKGEAGVISWLLEGWGGVSWVKTSYNSTIRKNYAGFGYTYDEDRDAFIAPQIYPSWILDEETCRWEAPVPYPETTDEEKSYSWDEDSLSWIEVEFVSV
jgi:hypothetical protein